MRLYEKREATPALSTLGCLVATAGMVLVLCGLARLFGAQPVFLTKPEEQQNRMALNGVNKINDAVKQLADDVGLASFHAFCVTQTTVTRQANGAEVLSMEPDARQHQGASFTDLAPVILPLLREGRNTKAGVPEAWRSKMRDIYFDITEDPWGRSWYILYGEKQPGHYVLRIGSRGHDGIAHTGDDITLENSDLFMGVQPRPGVPGEPGTVPNADT